MTSQVATATGADQRVLIVDDTADVRFMIPLQLRLDGVEFEEAGSGEEALARCAEERFDVVILDYRMPGLSGLDVAEQLRAEGYPAQLIVYSAYVDEQLAHGAGAIAVPVVDKADHHRLREVVRSAMKQVAGAR
jgi:CheY-like chemotaxis protein